MRNGKNNFTRFSQVRFCLLEKNAKKRYNKADNIFGGRSMVKLIKQGVYYIEGKLVRENRAFMTSDKKEEAVRATMSGEI